MQGANILSAALDQGDEKAKRPGILINPPISDYGAWVLVPRTGDFKEIQIIKLQGLMPCFVKKYPRNLQVCEPIRVRRIFCVKTAKIAFYYFRAKGLKGYFR